ncbi:uncharacterized protein EDB91DRAFT_1053836 [Suillus paluster]|uniref:uncharacterized protein n=1 Tax=Suillus paluster TaxID=48578 RepID=UPI001B87AEC8|nr:uncharacterized protein EDB91DRAFT_1053836 [Suillus paluster]KAG1739424.1 hypothetical protein EDB91DRAFT_1053836 [Suillus paluster]
MSLIEGSTSHVEDQQDAGSPSHPKDRQDEGSLQQQSEATTSVQARQKRRIAQLEEQLETLTAGRAVKEKQTNYYMSQGQALRRVVTLFDNVEDLVAKNNRRCDEEQQDEDATLEQDRMQIGYVALTQTLPWFHKKGCELDYDKYSHMIKTLRQGADGAQGDDTSKLKTLISEWINHEFKPDPPVDPEDKHSRGFTNNACDRLLCPAEIDWNNPAVRAGIRDRSEGYVVTDLFFPAYLYDKYATNLDDLEEGLFKGKILLQAYKAVFTSPSSAKDVEGNGNGADVIRNNRCAKKSSSRIKVKKHVRFTLSSVTSWRSVDGDFDYVQFWQTIVDFFERPPSREACHRVDRLLEWWTRKVFGRNHHNELSDTAKANMSVNALARQRTRCDDTAFDSP